MADVSCSRARIVKAAETKAGDPANSPVLWLAVVLVGAGLGTAWGIFGFTAHAATRGQRNLSPVRTLAAARPRATA